MTICEKVSIDKQTILQIDKKTFAKKNENENFTRIKTIKIRHRQQQRRRRIARTQKKIDKVSETKQIIDVLL